MLFRSLALMLTLVSSLVQREGPERAAYGNLCGSAAKEACDEPVLKGGFPLAYLSDVPGVSVEHQLSFGEDHLHLVALVLDIVIYWSATALFIGFVERRRAEARRHAIRGEI